ncbi:hypothetical protein [Actinoplanes sp. NPDC051859]|uniref:hypothetical protein n=1 Tax=Actinoplanes sp. NPDC051859 TaxID=3363909 RepID=UPI00379749F6
MPFAPTVATLTLDDLTDIAEQLAPVLANHHDDRAPLDAAATERAEAIFGQYGVTLADAGNA